MAEQNSSRADRAERVRSPTAVAAILLGMFILVYLAVAGLISILAPPYMHAVASGNGSAQISTTDITSGSMGCANESSPLERDGRAYAD